MKTSYFKHAKIASQNGDFKKVKIGCVVVYHNTILVKGWNMMKTNSTQCKYNSCRKLEPHAFPARVHAEIAALTKIKYLDIDFSRVSIYVYREYSNGKTAMARPCPSCMQMIRDIGIRNIYYTSSDGFVHEVIA